jgi:hypothetical protein
MPTLRMDAKLHNNSLTCGMQMVVFPKEVEGIYSTIDVMATNASPMPVAVSNPRNDIFKVAAAFDAFPHAKTSISKPSAPSCPQNRHWWILWPAFSWPWPTWWLHSTACMW